MNARGILLGFLFSVLAALAFSLVASLVNCLGLDAETRHAADTMATILGLYVGTALGARNGSWRTGLVVGLIYVGLWMLLWLYLMARWNPVDWLRLALPRLTLTHILWWGMAILVTIAGAVLGSKRRWFLAGLAATVGVWILCAAAYQYRCMHLIQVPLVGFEIQREVRPGDGTIIYRLTMDAKAPSRLHVMPYDCDQDYDQPHRGGDSNTTFLGQDLARLVAKLDARLPDSPVVCIINGGFFGESGWSIAHHEEPMAFEGKSYYPVDLLRPKDQGCFFLIANDRGRQHFEMASSITPEDVRRAQYVMGGVRPLRIDGKSLPLAPGAGGTGLRCSRTSVGWSADGTKFFMLVVHDPDGEMASQLQRRWHRPQTGGWDVREVQQYWEQNGVPYAVLFDGGESTQLALLQPGGYHILDSGYQYSFTIGYLFHRPLVVTLPILPASEAHRGVLNYLTIQGG